MADECKEVCTAVQYLEKKVLDLEKRVDNIHTDFGDKIIELEKVAAANVEKFKNIFNMLVEIKDIIKSLGQKMDEKNTKQDDKPRQLLYSVAGGVLVAIIIAGLKYLGV